MTNKAEGTHLVSEQDKELQITLGVQVLCRDRVYTIVSGPDKEGYYQLRNSGEDIEFTAKAPDFTTISDAIVKYFADSKIARDLEREHNRVCNDAITTYNTCKKLPSALLRERNEAVDLLYEAARYADEVTDSEGATEFAQRVRTFLSALTPDKK